MTPVQSSTIDAPPADPTGPIDAAPPIGLPAGDRAVLHTIIESLTELAGALDAPIYAQTQQGLALDETLLLIGQLDRISDTVKAARTQLERHGLGLRGWASNRRHRPELGLAAERSGSGKRIWFLKEATAAVVGLCAVDDQGQLDVEPTVAKKVIGRFMRYTTVKTFLATELKNANVDVNDLSEMTDTKPNRIKVTLSAPPTGDANA